MSDTMTIRQIRLLLELEAKATGGVWDWEDSPPTLYAGRSPHLHGLNLLGRLDPDTNTPANLDMICASRNALRPMCEALLFAWKDMAYQWWKPNYHNDELKDGSPWGIAEGIFEVSRDPDLHNYFQLKYTPDGEWLLNRQWETPMNIMEKVDA